VSRKQNALLHFFGLGLGLDLGERLLTTFIFTGSKVLVNLKLPFGASPTVTVALADFLLELLLPAGDFLLDAAGDLVPII